MSIFKYSIFSTTLAAAFLLVTSCDSTESSNVVTPGIFAVYTLTSIDENSLRAEANFRQTSASGKIVELDNPDQIVVVFPDSSETVLAKVGDGYGATFNDPVLSGSYRFELRREKFSATNTVVALPENIVFTQPIAGATVDGANPLTIEWNSSSAENPAVVRVSYDCDGTTFTDDLETTDSGSFDYNINGFLSSRVDLEAVNCEATIFVERKISGSTSSALALNSTIVATQSAQVSISVF